MKYILFGIILCMFLVTPVIAQESSDSKHDPDLDKIVIQLKNELQKTRSSYQKKIFELESRIDMLEKVRAKEKSESELEELLKEADVLKTEKKEEEASINRIFRGTERFQPQMNPEISLTGDFYATFTSSDAKYITDPGDFTDGSNQFNLRDVGFHFVSPLDPFTRGKFFLGIPGSGEVSLTEMVDEAYMEWLNLPGGMNLKIGKFFNQFGVINRYHDHGLPQVDRPRALNNLFAGNLGGFGLSGNVILPKLWSDVNELDLEITVRGDGYSFDDTYDSVIGVGHLKNYYDLTRNTYLELGLSGAYGYNDKQNEDTTTLAGIDLTCKWVPAGRSHYRTTEFRSEFILSQREEAGDTLDHFGFYTYIKNKMGARYWLGLRCGYTELVRDPFVNDHPILKDENEWDISPTVDFWQSEFVMYRVQYSYTDRSYGDNDHSFFLHTVWSMGPHKHEAY